MTCTTDQCRSSRTCADCLLPPVEWEDEVAAEQLDLSYFDAEGNEGTVDEVMSS